MARRSARDATIPGKTVLVVDDEPRMVEFITMNLELEGHRIRMIPRALN